MPIVYTINAFTDTPNGGNPAGVFLDAAGLSDADMMAIAAKVGFSETAFVSPSGIADVQVRFFTPNAEVDLCGHATIATFHLLHQQGLLGLGDFTQETKAGILPVSITQGQRIIMTQATPVFSDTPDPALVYNTLGLTPADYHPTLVPQVVSTGLRDLIVPITNLKTILAIQPNFEAVSKLSQQFDLIGYHLFCLETLAHDEATAHCRNLAPLVGIPEEAATGTGSGALACYLWQHQLITPTQAKALRFQQGYSMQRPSQIEAILTLENNTIAGVQVGGKAFNTGQLTI
jgi:PhzF family phenazine biosynthesis protein